MTSAEPHECIALPGDLGNILGSSQGLGREDSGQPVGMWVEFWG